MISRLGKAFTPLLLLPIVLGGAFLRFSHLGSQSYWMDEGYTVNAVRSQIENGTRRFATVLDSDATYFCPVYCYPTVWLSQSLGTDPAIYRALSALFGLLFIGVAYFISQTLFKDKRVSLLAALFISFSYWQIAWSRQARWYTLLEVFFWLCLGLFHKFLHADSTKLKFIYAAGTALSLFLAIFTQSIAYLLPFVMLIWYAIEKRPTKKPIGIFAVLVIGVLALTEFVLKLGLIASLLKNISLHNHLFYYLSFYGRTYWPAIIISLIGTCFVPRETRRTFGLLMIPFALYLISAAIFTNTVEYRYLFHTTVAFFLITASVSVKMADRFFSQARFKYAFVAAIIIGFFVSGLGILAPKSFYSLEADDPSTLKRAYYAYTPQSNFTGGYEFLQTHLKPDEVVISSQPIFNKIFLQKPGYWLAYDYLGRASSTTAITDTESYVNAITLHSQEDLEPILKAHHGYIVLDYMSLDGRISQDLLRYIQRNSILAFYDNQNSYSQLWIYQF